MVVIPFAVDEPVAAIRGCAVAGVFTAVVGVSLRNSPHRGTRYVALVGTGLTRQQAITGVQAAIWEGIYGGGVVNASSLSTGARALYRQILASTFDPTGEALVVDLVRAQDQVIDRITPAVPEPSAALVFAVGLGVSGAVLRPRRKHDKASVRI